MIAPTRPNTSLARIAEPMTAPARAGVEQMTRKARDYLDQIESTLATLGKMTQDIDPSLYSEDAGEPTLRQVYRHLLAAEDLLAEICANNVEMQELDDSGPLFPFEAWDIVAAQPVTVTGWFNSTRYRLSTGETALPSEITTVFPAWYSRAKQALADARDEHDTQDDVRYGGAL